MASKKKVVKSAFTNGHKKHGGRKAGTPNKVNASVRDRILSLVEPEQIYEDIEKVDDPGRRAELKIKLLEYAIAKPQRITIKDERDEQPSEIKFSFMEPIDVTDEVSTFSLLPVKKQAELLKKAKVKVKARPERPPHKPTYREPTRPTHEPTHEPSRSEPIKAEPKQEPKKSGQMETVYASKFKYDDFIIK